MKFNCHRVPDAFYGWQDRRWHRKFAWHRWFAWHPVSLSATECRWLEHVERKQIENGWDCTHYQWEYREVSK